MVSKGWTATILRLPPMKFSPRSLGLGLAGALIAVGGVALRPAGQDSATGLADLEAGTRFWIAFVVGGLLIGVIALAINIANRLARLVLVITVAAMGLAAAAAVQDTAMGTDDVLGFGFITGGIIISVAVMVTDVVRRPE